MKNNITKRISAKEILLSKGVQFPPKRSPRDFNLVLIAMEEYADQFRDCIGDKDMDHSITGN